jgi:hypothetical protein
VCRIEFLWEDFKCLHDKKPFKSAGFKDKRKTRPHCANSSDSWFPRVWCSSSSIVVDTDIETPLTHTTLILREAPYFNLVTSPYFPSVVYTMLIISNFLVQSPDSPNTHAQQICNCFQTIITRSNPVLFIVSASYNYFSNNLYFWAMTHGLIPCWLSFGVY